MAIVPAGYPTAETTGVPDGTTLTTHNGTLIVNRNNTVISGLRITGNVVINAQNVTMENCVIDTTTPYHAILIPDGYDGFTLRNSEINGNGRTVNAISGSGTFLNNDIHDVENGINVYGASLIQDNFIHDLAGGPAAHFDGIENNGASNVQIIHNTVINDYDQTSAVMLDTYFGNLRNITVDGNYLVGGGYTIYLDGRFSGGTVDDDTIRITNNQIVSGRWGPFAFYDDDPVQFGNVVNGVLLPGTDTVQSSISLTLPANVQNLTLTGSAHINGTGNNLNNLLVGNSGNNVLDGKAGADTMRGAAGNDIYRVDSAGDQVIEAAGGGTDTVYASVSWAMAAGQEIEFLRAYGAAVTSGVTLGGNGLNNHLIGGSGIDTLNGGAGDDRLNGGAGADIMTGGAGNDIYYVDNAGDKVNEAAGGGSDNVYASVSWAMAAGQEIEFLRAYGAGATSGVTLTGNGLNNYLIGGSGVDTLNGGAGDDRLNGGAGADIMTGGAGNDIYYVDRAGDQVIEAVGGGSDNVYASVSWAMAAGQEIEFLRAYGAGATSGVTLTGNGLNNYLIGGAGVDTLNGGAGVDTLNGGAGNDRLDGGAGADIMTGGAGNDIYYVDNAGDKVNEAGGGGTDTVYASVSWVMSAGQEIEYLRAYGAGATSSVILTGNNFNNTVVGGSGNDILNGGLGNDTLAGGAGNDTFRFSSALGPTNIDRITDFSPANDIIELDRAVFTGLVSGLLSVSAFSLGSANGSAPQVVYNQTTGALFYDSNGSAAGGSTQFATLAGAPSLTNSSFRVV